MVPEGIELSKRLGKVIPTQVQDWLGGLTNRPAPIQFPPPAKLPREPPVSGFAQTGALAGRYVEYGAPRQQFDIRIGVLNESYSSPGHLVVFLGNRSDHFRHRHCTRLPVAARNGAWPRTQ